MAELDSRGEAEAPRHQLPLAVRLRDDATLENFHTLPALEPVLSSLRTQLEPAGEALIYLHGPAGSGKSHLLQACCHLDGTSTLYLPLSELGASEPEAVLQGVESLRRVCIDDLHDVAGKPDWELALFHLCNRARQRGCRLVFAAAAAPRALGVSLPDLRSRLGGGIVFQLARCDDEEKSAVLRFRAGRRGLSLSPAVADYIVSRAPRDMEKLLQVLDRLDEASLAEQRALSKPFVRQALGW